MSKLLRDCINSLREAFKDEDYKHSWIANIAMAQIDAEEHYRQKNNKVGKYLNKRDRHTIANNGAKYFIKQLETR